MDRIKLIKRLTCLIFLILLVNFAANKLYWYSSLWYLDMIMHFLGGFFIALLSFHVFSPKNVNVKFVLKTLLLVLLIGIGWEWYEIFVNEIIARNPFDYVDAFSDIAFDIFGGAVAVLYFFKRIMLQSKDHS